VSELPSGSVLNLHFGPFQQPGESTLLLRIKYWGLVEETQAGEWVATTPESSIILDKDELGW